MNRLLCITEIEFAAKSPSHNKQTNKKQNKNKEKTPVTVGPKLAPNLHSSVRKKIEEEEVEEEQGMLPHSYCEAIILKPNCPYTKPKSLQ